MAETYGFGDCELDRARRELRRAGRVVAVEPKVLLVLQQLLAHADEIVSKQDLLDAVWPGTKVNEIAIARCISAARRAIGDRRGPEAAIRTIHGIGYRYVGAVTVQGSAAPSAPRDVARAAMPAAGERKQVSVLCAQLADSALTSRDLDARHALMLQLEAIAGAAIQAFGGTVFALAERSVHGVFGAPVASEDHAQCALLAARQLMARWERDAGISPGAGIDSGSAVVDLRAPPLPLALVGDVVDGAARLARQAKPGEILASARAAQRLARRGARATERVEGAAPLRIVEESAPDPIRTAADTRFVGRVAELSALDAELQGARRGTGRIVCITGEPGIGKSRLVSQFVASLPPTHVNVVSGLCQSVGRHTPLLPLRALLLELIGAGDTSDGAAISKALDRALRRIGVTHPPFRAALRHLLGIGGPDEALIALGPAAVRARSFAALHEVIARLGRERPTVVIIEDLHWIDATSDGFLASLVERLRSQRILLVVTRRPGSDPAWITGGGATQLVLGPLSAIEGARLVQAIWATGKRSEALAQALFARSGGNPFFLEELTQVAMRDGAQADVPLDVETVIATRIDQLSPPAKRALQAAAVIGSEVPRALLRPLMRDADDAFAIALDELEASDFLREAAGAGEPTLVFKHVLTREVAYGSMIARERRRFHGDVASMLRERFPELAAVRPEMLAQHAAAAGAHADAAEAWARAGERAAARSAFTEAHDHVRLGLALVDRIADPELRKRLLIRLQLTRGHVLSMLRGFTDLEGAEALEAARALCDEIDDPVEVGRVLHTLWPVYFARGRFPLVIEIGEALHRNGTRAGQLDQISSAHASLGATRFFLGEFAEAARLLAQGARDGTEVNRGRVVPPRGYDFVVFCESYLARANWVLGAPASALAGCARAVEIAEAANAPWLKVQALYFSGVVHQYRRDHVQAQAFATRLLAVAEENEFRYWILLGRLLQGWCRERAGAGGGIVAIEAAIADLERMGTVIGRAYFLCQLAECQLAAGDDAAADAAIERAFVHSKAIGERQWEPEQHRLRGEILLRRAATGDGRARARLRAAAIASFAAARASARELGTPALELRALLSMHASDPQGAEGRSAATAIATLLKRIDGDRGAPDLAAAARILRKSGAPAAAPSVRRNSAGNGKPRGRAR